MKVYSWLLFVFVIGVSEAKEPSRITQGFRYTALGSSLFAIASDGLVEYYYGKYKDADVPEQCEKYRGRTQFCENVRDVCIWTAGLSLVGSIVAEKFTKPRESHGFLDKFHLKLCGKKAPGVLIYYEI